MIPLGQTAQTERIGEEEHMAHSLSWLVDDDLSIDTYDRSTA